jgi:hypothetical protein
VFGCCCAVLPQAALPHVLLRSAACLSLSLTSAMPHSLPANINIRLLQPFGVLDFSLVKMLTVPFRFLQWCMRTRKARTTPRCSSTRSSGERHHFRWLGLAAPCLLSWLLRCDVPPLLGSIRIRGQTVAGRRLQLNKLCFCRVRVFSGPRRCSLRSTGTTA